MMEMMQRFGDTLYNIGNELDHEVLEDHSQGILMVSVLYQKYSSLPTFQGFISRSSRCMDTNMSESDGMCRCS